MKAKIGDDVAALSVEWSVDDPVTPELVASIRALGDSRQIQWLDTPFAAALQDIIDLEGSEDLLDRLYDEDERLLDRIGLLLQPPHLDTPSKEMRTFVRLYLPVLIVILELL